MFAACSCVLVVGSWSLFVECLLLTVVVVCRLWSDCRLLVGCWLLVVVQWLLSRARCLVLVACCVLSVVCCMLVVGRCRLLMMVFVVG